MSDVRLLYAYSHDYDHGDILGVSEVVFLVDGKKVVVGRPTSSEYGFTLESLKELFECAPDME